MQIYFLELFLTFKHVAMAPSSRMKAPKPSKVVKPKKSKRLSTVSTRNHRFQPFSERVAKLKIDPIRRRRKAEDPEELSEDAATYLGKGLEEWRDLNLSQTFTAFAREAVPLCDSLPVVLHNREKIVDLLVAYIEKGDALSLEPLLSLLSHFAHDLDTRFEEYFERAVSTITAVAANHSDPAVVEWSFTCLAWLFKYLSRLLTPDLRPLYDLMSAYLGKEQQRPFIVRFAAESLSFLLRKAATTYERDPRPLDLIVSHIFGDVQGVEHGGPSNLYQQGVITLLTEATKGVQNGIHSSGLAVWQCMLKQADDKTDTDHEAVLEVVVGTLTSLIHHTTAETFRPIQDATVDLINESNTLGQPSSVRFASQLVFTIATVRKGTRVSDWSSLISILKFYVQLDHDHVYFDAGIRSSLLSALATTMQSATIDAMLPNLDTFETIRSGRWAPYFIRFCDLFARLGRERFQTFLLPQFQKFIMEQWQGNEDAIFTLLPKLSAQGQAIKLSCPDKLQDAALLRIPIASVGDLESDDEFEALASANLILAAIPHLKLRDDRLHELQSTLLTLVRTALETKDSRSKDFYDFTLGASFTVLLDKFDYNMSMTEIWLALCTGSPRFLHLPKFWSNLLRYMQICKLSFEDLEGSDRAGLETSLLHCLSMPSHYVRQSALDILQSMYSLRNQVIPDVLSAAITIESTSISLETSRSISMNIRRLAQGYSISGLDLLMQKAVPTYCFGLLHLQLGQAWEDAVNALAEVSRSPIGEEVITSLAQTWLEGTPGPVESDIEQPQALLNIESSGFQVASDFECSNLAKISAICQQVFDAAESGYPSNREQFRIDHVRTLSISPNARSQALRALRKITKIAEKKSRMLVPVLLRWAGPIAVQSDETLSSRWSRKDQKAMLDIFAQFTNPKVLFKSSEAYAALLNLCSNGDVEIQRSALKAVFAWKEPAVNLYEEHLINFLDEARFREETSVFLQAAHDDEASIRVEHQPKLMPVLLRLLYGRAVAGGKQGQGSRRKAIFVALSRFDEDVLGEFVDITLGPCGSVKLISEEQLDEQSLDELKMPPRQQLGMLNMVHDMLETLGSDLERFATILLNAVCLCTIAATRQLDDTDSNNDLQDASLLRTIRQVGIQCIARVYSTMEESDLEAYAKIVVEYLISPRLDKFHSENTQSVSGTLRLLSAWTTLQKTGNYLVASEGGLIHQLAHLLRESSAKDEVKLFILQDILDNLLRMNIRVLTPAHVTAFVKAIGEVLNCNPSRDVLDACVSTFTQLADSVDSSKEAQDVIRVCTGLLTKPNKVVSPGTKTGLLRTMLPLLGNFDIIGAPQIYDVISGLFTRISDQASRGVLSMVLVKYSRNDPELLESAQICEDLNAIGSRLDEPDYDRRERGFAKIYDQYASFSFQQWQPIVHNCMFFIRDVDDLVNRSSASRALERFIDATAGNTKDCKPLVSNAVLSGIEYGMKSSSELVRAEYLRVLGHIVEMLPDWPVVSDMKGLTVDGDDEASLFTNVLHIQQHRRLRALRRLSDEAARLIASSVMKFFIPLVEHFVFDQAEGDTGRTLANQAVLTIGDLARALNWSAFRKTFRQYVGYLTSKEDQEKVTLRLLGVLVDALTPLEEVSGASRLSHSTSDRSEVIARDFLPPLLDYIHHKDESTVDRRMPVAVTIVKLLLLLPTPELSSRLAPVLTDTCHVLRSRSQEARDQTRKTLATILSLVGPSYLGFILKELRGALQRGYQLHVLSFTVHSLLVNSIDACRPDDLDYCLSELTSVIMDDIFGITGQEKDAEEYKSGMKEVNSSKSYDTMELLARATPIQRLGQLIRPIRSLLSEKLDLKMVKKLDELLTRLRKGVDQNPAADSRDMLIFCHEIIRQVYTEQNAPHSNGKKTDYKTNRYLVQMESANKSTSRGTAAPQTFKLVSFALNLLRRVLRRHEDLQTPNNLAGFLPIAGDALVQGHEEVQLSSVKLLSTIMKVSLPDLETNAPVYVKEAVTLIKASPNMTTDSAKVSLELITAVLREKRSVKINDKDIAEVLNALKSDIDEPDRQGIIYKFLRAVLGRKIMVTEVYEIMDAVGKVMVTSADRTVRESARSAFLQFVIDYPQGKDRWNKQAAFFVENLKYERSAGRQSVMELLHQLLSKLSDEVLEQLAFTLFVALVPVQVGDSDQPCRKMAGMLISKLFERASDEQMSTFLTLMEKWMQKHTNKTIQVAALQCWMILIRIKAPSGKSIDGFRDEIDRLLDSNDMAETDEQDQVVQNALQAFEVLLDVVPTVAFAKESAGIWRSLQKFVALAHADTKEAVAKLIGSCFSNVASASSKASAGLSAVPLRGSEGLKLGADEMREICYASLKALRVGTTGLSETLVAQTVRNLVFLGRCFAANAMNWRTESTLASDDSDEGEVEENEASTRQDSSAIAYLFNRLSYIIRQDNFPTVSRTAALQCQSALLNHVPAIPDLQSVVRPLYSLTDPLIPQPPGEAHKVLIDSAREMLAAVQKKVGTETYVAALGAARAEAKERREERRQKRRIEAVSAPEKWAREKRKKYELKKTKMKAKGMEARGRRRGW